MNEQARALLLAGVTLFGAGNGSGYLLGRTTAPAAPVAVKVGAPSPASAPPKVGDNSPSTPAPKAAAPSPRTAAAPRLKRPAPIVQERPQAKKKRTTPTPRPSGLPSCAVVRREYDSMNTAQRLAAYYRATSEQVAHGRRCLGI
jgi:hypothetical protein